MALLSTQIDASDLLSFDRVESDHAARKAAARATLTAAAVANGGSQCVMCLRDVIAGVAPPAGCKTVFTVAHVAAIGGPREVRAASASGSGAGSRMATLDICDDTAAAQLTLWREQTQVLAAAGGGGPRGIRVGDVVLVAGVKVAPPPGAPASDKFASGTSGSLPRLSTHWQSGPVMLLARRRGSGDTSSVADGAAPTAAAAADADNDSDYSDDERSAAGLFAARSDGSSRQRFMDVAHPALHALAACLIARRLGLPAGLPARRAASITTTSTTGVAEVDAEPGVAGVELPCLAAVLQLTAAARTADVASPAIAATASAPFNPALVGASAPIVGVRARTGRRPPVFTDTDAEAMEQDTVRAFPAISVSSFIKTEAWRCKLRWVEVSGCRCDSCTALDPSITQLSANPAAARSPAATSTTAAASRTMTQVAASPVADRCIGTGRCAAAEAVDRSAKHAAATCNLVCRYAAVLQHAMLAEWTTLLPSLPTVTQSSLASQSTTAAGAGSVSLRRWRWAPGTWVNTLPFSLPAAAFHTEASASGESAPIASGAELEALVDAGAVPASGISLRVHVLTVAAAVGKDAVYTIAIKGGEDVVCRAWTATVCLADSPTLPLTLSVRQFANGTHDAGKQQFDAFIKQLHVAQEACSEASATARALHASPASCGVTQRRRPCFLLRAIRAERGRADGTVLLFNTPHSKCERAMETSHCIGSPANRTPAAAGASLATPGVATPGSRSALASDAAGTASVSGQKRPAAALTAASVTDAAAATHAVGPVQKRARVETSPLLPDRDPLTRAPTSPLGGRVQALFGFVDGISWLHARVFVGAAPPPAAASSASGAGTWTELTRDNIHLMLQPHCTACKREIEGWPAAHSSSGRGAGSGSALLMCQSLDCATRASSRGSVTTGASHRGLAWRYAPAVLHVLPCASTVTGQPTQLASAAMVDAAAMRSLLAGISPKMVASCITGSAQSRVVAAAASGSAASASASSSSAAAQTSDSILVEDAVFELLTALVHHDSGLLLLTVEQGAVPDSQSSDEAGAGKRACMPRLLDVLPGGEP